MGLMCFLVGGTAAVDREPAGERWMKNGSEAGVFTYRESP